MIKNYYYLVAGILAIIFSITHAWNGQSIVLPSLNVDTISADTKTIFFYVWHIITAENMLFGLSFLFMSVHKDLSKVRFTAWVIAILMVFHLIVIFGGTLLYNASALKNTLIDSIAIVIYVSLIVLGTRVKDKKIGALLLKKA
ncbi:hypothetical protein [Haliscomenobacter sp.]|uniref:hypothetical protein n=1 Tax=Haliscomenobacter sp. TaxID=2717303 RepID=UPI0033650BE6